MCGCHRLVAHPFQTCPRPGSHAVPLQVFDPFCPAAPAAAAGLALRWRPSGWVSGQGGRRQRPDRTAGWLAAATGYGPGSAPLCCLFGRVLASVRMPHAHHQPTAAMIADLASPPLSLSVQASTRAQSPLPRRRPASWTACSRVDGLRKQQLKTQAALSLLCRRGARVRRAVVETK